MSVTRKASSALHIVSWNVASWATTASNIAKHHGSVSAWLDRHNIDILCLQEVKATKPKLLSLPPNCLLNPHLWDIFLSPCVTKPGLNGVATLVRKDRFVGGFPTVGASAKPFGIPDLDNQGRCVLTDHGAFTLINIYAPYDGELGVQLGLKLRFMDALYSLVRKIQASGRPVICVGDFNIARYSADVHFEFRRVDIDDLVSNIPRSMDICETRIGNPLRSEVVGILGFLKLEWTALRQTLLETRKIVEFNSNNGNNQSPKFALKLGKEKLVQIGQRQTSASACDGIANPNPIITSDGVVYKPAGVLSIADLFEVISKLYSLEFSEQARAAFSDIFAKPRACNPLVERFDKLISECGLVDSYLQVNPAGRQLTCERFTCWDQYRNERYENKGSRIDYIFVDKTIVDGVRLSEGEREVSQLAISSDRSKALQAVTANGQWKPVPFHGGGIDADQFLSADAKNFEFIFTNPPHTGIVYTAPLFSDHVACSCVVDLSALDPRGIDSRVSDSLGVEWKSAMTECQVIHHSHPAKTHSLKHMFARAAGRKSVSASSEIVSEMSSQNDVPVSTSAPAEVIEIVETPESPRSPKRARKLLSDT